MFFLCCVASIASLRTVFLFIVSFVCANFAFMPQGVALFHLSFPEHDGCCSNLPPYLICHCRHCCKIHKTTGGKKLRKDKENKKKTRVWKKAPLGPLESQPYKDKKKRFQFRILVK